jgi:hypothetical protein
VDRPNAGTGWRYFAEKSMANVIDFVPGVCWKDFSFNLTHSESPWSTADG